MLLTIIERKTIYTLNVLISSENVLDTDYL